MRQQEMCVVSFVFFSTIGFYFRAFRVRFGFAFVNFFSRFLVSSELMVNRKAEKYNLMERTEPIVVLISMKTFARVPNHRLLRSFVAKTNKFRTMEIVLCTQNTLYSSQNANAKRFIAVPLNLFGI